MTEGQKQALSHAGKMLGMRMMTCRELLDKLRQKGYCEEDSLFAVRRMEEIGAIDDLEYARRYAGSKASAGYGELRIRRELRARGIDPVLIDEALTGIPDSREQIEEYLKSRIKTSSLDRKEAKRISDALARRGFRWEDISAVMREYLEED